MATTSYDVLRDREFLRYFVSRMLSVAGNIVTLVTLPIIVYRTSGSASLTALVAALEAAPYLIFGLFSGALTDRWNRKKVMVVADVLSALLVATVPLADLLWQLTVPHVLVVAFLGPTIGVFFDGAVFGALPTLVGRSRIPQANSVTWAAASVVEMVMPSLVGVVLAFVHPAWLLGFDALTFAASAALIGGITRPMYDATRERPPLTARQILGDIREGLDYLVRHAGVRTFTIIGFLQCFGAGGFVALMVVWIDQRLGVGTEGLRFGLVYGAWSVGGLTASLALPLLIQRVSVERIALTALPVSAAIGVVVPFVTSWWMAGLALMAWGIFYMLVVINSVTYRQVVTPEHLLGRVNTAGRMLAWGMGWTGGALVAGVLVGWFGLVPTLVVLSSTGVLATVVAWTSPLTAQLGSSTDTSSLKGDPAAPPPSRSA
jgi:MFS family permease